MTYEAYPTECDPRVSCTIVRGADADWFEYRAAEAEAARASWRAWDWSEFELPGRDFRGAFLAGVDLHGADLTGCRFDRAVLVGADLSRATLEGVSARGADLRGTSITGATLDGADFGGAEFGARTCGHSVADRTADDVARRGFRLCAVERGFDFRDAEGRCLAVVVAPDWQTAIYRLARARGATRLALFDHPSRAYEIRDFTTQERRCASIRAEDGVRSREETLWQDE